MNKWVILTQPDCLYCTKALKLLRDKGEFNVIRMDITEKPDLKTFIQAQGLTTVPQIYLNGNWMGGYTDLVENHDFD